MAWGVSVWGLEIWGGGPTTENLSFEVPDLSGNRGRANAWDIASDSEQVDAGVFGFTGLTWSPWANFEELWRAPFLVHFESDSGNQITSPITLSATWAECATLMNEAVDNFQAHILTVGDVHRAKDIDNYFNFPTLTAADSGIIPILAYIMQLIFNEHMPAWPTIHGKWDLQNLIEAPTPVDLPTTAAMLVELKQDWNNHVALTGYGATNSDALFAFLASHLTAGGFIPDLLAESYERLWDIRALLPTFEEQGLMVVVDGPSEATIVITSIPDDGDYYSISDGTTTIEFEFDTDGVYESDRTQVDINGVSTIGEVRYYMAGELNLSALNVLVDEPASDTIVIRRGDGGRTSESTFSSHTAVDHMGVTLSPEPLWPFGHMEFLHSLELIASEVGITEALAQGWLLPGSDASWPNEIFVNRYYDAINETWRFKANHLSDEFAENFEADWRDNDEFYAKYWTGSEWSFSLTDRPTHVEIGGFGDYYTFVAIDLDGFGVDIKAQLPNNPPYWSPNLRIRSATGYTAAIPYQQMSVTVNTAVSGSKVIPFTLPLNLAAGGTSKVDLNDEAFTLGEVTLFTGYSPIQAVTGTVVLEGHEQHYEDFSGDWTLSLDD